MAVCVGVMAVCVGVMAVCVGVMLCGEEGVQHVMCECELEDTRLISNTVQNQITYILAVGWIGE